MKHPAAYLLLLSLVTAGALAIRLPRLCERPMHADEAVQATRAWTLWEQGSYVYDPDEFHGPTLPYFSQLSLRLEAPANFGQTTEATYRIVPVLFGVGLISLLWLLGDAVGRPAVVAAGLLTAVSPGMVFYSRYFIHETPLVFFTLAAIVGGWRYACGGRLTRWGWLLAAGVALGMMQATKETSVLAFFAMGLAAVLATAWTGTWTRFWEGLVLEPPDPEQPDPDSAPESDGRLAWGLVVAISTAAVTAAVWLSSFLANPRGPLDGILAYYPWISRAAGESSHTAPWSDYLSRLAWRSPEVDGAVWSEGLILVLALIGFVAALFFKKALPGGASPRFVRWLAFYTLTLIVVYSAIPYKTPWCMLTFLQGLILLAGVGAMVVLRLVPTRPVKALAAILLLAAAGQLGWQAYRASYLEAAEPTNPYVYVQTRVDIERFFDDLSQLAQAMGDVNPDGRPEPVKLIWNDIYDWPLPWYMREFDEVERFTQMPDDPAAPLIVAAHEFDAELTERLGDDYLMTGVYEVRLNVFALLFVREDIWMAHLENLGRL